VAHSYRIQVHCLQPSCDFYQWIVKENLDVTLLEATLGCQDFTCPTHGPQSARPFQAEVKRIFTKSKRRSTSRSARHRTAQRAVEQLAQ